MCSDAQFGSGQADQVVQFDELGLFIKSLAEEHRQFVADHRMQWEEHIREMEVGFSFYLKNKNGGVALVGVCDRGWVLYQIEPKPINRLIGNGEGQDIVAMLLPDRTEFYARELISPERGMAALRSWLDGQESDLLKSELA